jgi:predicted RNase H-like nuclease (RuvC/YqgF family)
MELTGKSNIIRGASYLIPVDRMHNQEPFGFLEHEVLDGKNEVQDTQFDPHPHMVELEQQTRDMTVIIDRLEADMSQLKRISDDQRVFIDEQTKELAASAKVIEEQAKTLVQQRTDLEKAQETIKMLRDAAKNSDALGALSPLELIRIAINRWLKGVS